MDSTLVGLKLKIKLHSLEITVQFFLTTMNLEIYSIESNTKLRIILLKSVKQM